MWWKAIWSMARCHPPSGYYTCIMGKGLSFKALLREWIKSIYPSLGSAMQFSETAGPLQFHKQSRDWGLFCCLVHIAPLSIPTQSFFYGSSSLASPVLGRNKPLPLAWWGGTAFHDVIPSVPWLSYMAVVGMGKGHCLIQHPEISAFWQLFTVTIEKEDCSIRICWLLLDPSNILWTWSSGCPHTTEPGRLRIGPSVSQRVNEC